MPSASDSGPRDLGEKLGLPEIVLGIANDLKALREGHISIRDARARAELARELLRAVRMVIDAQKFIEGQALPAPTAWEEKHGQRNRGDMGAAAEGDATGAGAGGPTAPTEPP